MSPLASRTSQDATVKRWYCVVRQMDQTAMSLTFGYTHLYTDDKRQAFIDHFTDVAVLLGATANTAARYAPKVWQLEKNMAEVIYSCRLYFVQGMILRFLILIFDKKCQCRVPT